MNNNIQNFLQNQLNNDFDLNILNFLSPKIEEIKEEVEKKAQPNLEKETQKIEKLEKIKKKFEEFQKTCKENQKIEKDIKKIKEEIEKIKEGIEKIEKDIENRITTKAVKSFIKCLNAFPSRRNFSISLSTSYKKHYKEIKKVMEVFSEKKMKRLAAVCASLLENTELHILIKNIKPQNIQQKESPVIQKLKVIFIATQMFEKRDTPWKKFKQPITYDQYSLQNQLNNDFDLNILNFLSPKIEKIEEEVEKKAKQNIEEETKKIEKIKKIKKNFKQSQKTCEENQKIEKNIEKIEKEIENTITTKAVKSFIIHLNTFPSRFNFAIPLLTSYKKHYKEIKKVMEGFSEKKMKRLAAVCASLLKNTGLHILLENIKPQNIHQKESPVIQKLKVIFIATQMFEKRVSLCKGFKQPCTYMLDQSLSSSFINKIFLYSSDKIHKIKARKNSIADVIFNASFKWIEKDNRLKLLDIQGMIKYCKSCKINKKEMRSLNLQSKEEVNENIEKIVSYCTSLYKLNLASTNIRDLIKLKNLVKLKELNLESCGYLSKEEFPKIKDYFSDLTVLNLSRTHIDSLEGLELFKLEELNLFDCTQIPPEGFSKISDNYPNLEVLDLSLTRIENLKGLEKLSRLKVLKLVECDDISSEEFLNFTPPPNLQILDLRGTEINNLEIFKNLSYLESLTISTCYARNFSLKYIDTCPNLKKLYLIGSDITSFQEIGVLTQLENLKLNSCSHLSGEAFFEIENKFPNLENLDVSSSSIASLEGLTGLLKLKKLDLSGCKNLTFTKESFFNIENKIPNLEVLDVSNTSIASLEGLTGLLKLKKLDLSGCKNLTFTKESFFNLTELDLSRTQIASFEELGDLPNLEILYLNDCKNFSLEKENPIIQKKFPKLKKLFLEKNLTLYYLNGLKNLPQLEYLSLWGCKQIPTEEILSLKDKCPLLKELDLKGITLKSLKGLEELLQLERLKLTIFPETNKKELMLLKKKCPLIEITKA